MVQNSLKIVFFTVVLGCLTAISHASESPWQFEAGFGSRNVTPIVLVGGLSYKDLSFRVQGLGIHNGVNDFWCGIRGSLLWKFFRDLPYNFDVGVGSGYEYAEAPNNIHKALNNANNGKYLLPYNYKENLDISLELWTHLYGIYTQIGVPAYQFKSHDFPKVLWGFGYTLKF